MHRSQTLNTYKYVCVFFDFTLNLFCTYLANKIWRAEQVSGKKLWRRVVEYPHKSCSYAVFIQLPTLATIHGTHEHLLKAPGMCGWCLHQYFARMELHVLRHSWSSRAASSSVIPTYRAGPHNFIKGPEHICTWTTAGHTTHSSSYMLTTASTLIYTHFIFIFKHNIHLYNLCLL